MMHLFISFIYLFLYRYMYRIFFSVIRLKFYYMCSFYLIRTHPLRQPNLKKQQWQIKKGIHPGPTLFTRPIITHFEEKNSRPDF